MKLLATAVVLGTATGLCGAAPAVATAPAGTLSETSQLGDRRFVVTGDRAYEVGAENATYPATGWHIRGEMGGFWSPPIKLLDGVWFAADGTWLTASRFTAHPGYRNAGQCSGLQAGGEGPRWEGRQGPSSALTGTVLLPECGPVLRPSGRG